MISHYLQRLLRRFGYRVERIKHSGRHPDYPEDFQDDEIRIIQRVRPYTMTSNERIVSLIRSVRYLVENKIHGDVVECGVWRGGSIMAAALTLLQLADTNRHLWLYDTFQGMTRPTEIDVSPTDGSALAYWERVPDWCYASLDDVRRAVLSVGYPETHYHFIVGKVEQTIPAQIPTNIALLRLDTDWYESTHHELVHLFPRLAPGGIVIIDDYGHWQGARKATDQYLQTHRIPLFLSRIDSSARIAVKL